MPYLASGARVDQPSSICSKLSFIPQIFWGVVNVIVLFFQTITEPFFGNPSSHSTDYRVPGRGPDPFGPGGGGPRRRMGGFRRGPGAPSAPPMAGGG